MNLSSSWPATAALLSWNTVVSLPDASGHVAPAYRNVVTVVSNGPCGLPLTLMLSGNTKDSMADFEIPLGAQQITVKWALSYDQARNAGTILQPTPTLPLATSYDYAANKLVVRIRLAASTVGSALSQWGPVFDGAAVYVRVE